MKFTPHDYQLRGMQTLLKNEGAGLFLDPGLGKTTTVLGAFAALKGQKMLVVVPLLPMYQTWPNEIQKWDEFGHLSFAILHGPQKDEALLADVDIHLINPEGLNWLFNKHPARNLPKWDVLCVDESTKFKHPNTKRFKILKKYLPRFQRRWILTGTPAPNGLMDLFGQSYVMDLGQALGRYITHYRTKYFDADFMGYTYTPREDSLEKITAALEDHVLQLSAEDHLKMPDLMSIERRVILDAETMKIYREMEKDFIIEVGDSSIIAPNAAAVGGKCRQICSGFLYDEDMIAHPLHDKKMQALEELVEETNGHPLLILYEFIHERDLILNYLQEARCITGASSIAANSIVSEFNEGKIPYIVAHSASMHGLNIQAKCNRIVWYSIPWNLENYIQANYRVYRQGQQESTVYIYHLVASGTIDERVARVLVDKGRTQDAITDALKDTPYELQET